LVWFRSATLVVSTQMEDGGGAQQGVQQHAAMELQLPPPLSVRKLLLLLFTFLSISQSAGGGVGAAMTTPPGS